MNEQPQDPARIEAVLGISFRDPALLREALTHSSYINEHRGGALRDNERLEFLGDAVLDIIVADMLFRRFPHASEGELTQLRAALVRTESLAAIGRRFQLGDFLLLGHGEATSGGRQRLSTLCSAMEALIAAIYLDRGLEAVSDFISPPLQEILAGVIKHRLHVDARSELNERVQARLHAPPRYQVDGADGPEHEKEFLITVHVGEQLIGSGRGPSKRSAAQAAAADALRRLDGDEGLA